MITVQKYIRGPVGKRIVELVDSKTKKARATNFGSETAAEKYAEKKGWKVKQVTVADKPDNVKEEFTFKQFLLCEGSSEFEKIEKNKVPLTDEERKECMSKKAVWHFSPSNKPSPAVWKSVDKNGKTTYITHTHRAYNTAPTLKGAIGRYHDFIKGTA